MSAGETFHQRTPSGLVSSLTECTRTVTAVYVYEKAEQRFDQCCVVHSVEQVQIHSNVFDHEQCHAQCAIQLLGV